MEKKENINAADKLRNILAWCDSQDKNFTIQFQDIHALERCYDACAKYGIEFADRLTWDTEDPDYVNDPQYLLAKEVNAILMIYYYKVGELTIPMLTQAKKDFVELLGKLKEMSVTEAFEVFNGHDEDFQCSGYYKFHCDYKNLSVEVHEDIEGNGCLMPVVTIWDDYHNLSFEEDFGEILYGYGFGCTAVHDDLFTREVDVRDVLGLPGHKFNVGSYSLRKYLEENPEQKDYLTEVESMPKLYVPDDVFDGDYFKLVEKVRITLFIIYEEWCTEEKQEILDDYAFYTDKRVNNLNDMTDEDWTAFMQAVEKATIKWREFIQSREL